jgi:hypothetical protein
VGSGLKGESLEPEKTALDFTDPTGIGELETAPRARLELSPTSCDGGETSSGVSRASEREFLKTIDFRRGNAYVAKREDLGRR